MTTSVFFSHFLVKAKNIFIFTTDNMKEIIILFAALLPAIVLWLYVWKKDPQKEPTALLVKAVLWGVAICIPVALIELGIDRILLGTDAAPKTLIDTTLGAFLSAALPEEAFKLLALWLVLRKNPYFDEHYDGIVYAVSVGLGFAAFENILYVFSEDNWVGVAFTRALLAVPGHYAFAVLMGYYYSLHHFVDRSTKTALYIFFLPFMAHGIYDAIAMSGEVNPVVGGISAYLLIYFCIKMHKFAKQKMLAQIERDESEKNFG